MDKKEIEMLERNGWNLDCESPFELSHVDGSFSKQQAAYYVLEGIRAEEEAEDQDDFTRRLIFIDVEKLSIKEAESVIEHYRQMIGRVSRTHCNEKLSNGPFDD